MKKTNNFKKVLSLVLALMMVMTTFVLVPLTVSAEVDAWDGTTVDTDWYVLENGTSWDNAYEIADAADLAGWSKLSNENPTIFDGKYFKLTNDIDLANKEFTPIVAGTYNATTFNVSDCAIHLDGQKHTIKNMTISSGSRNATGGTQVSNQSGAAFFLSLGDNSEIKNLHFVGANVTSTGTLANPAVLVAYGSLANCTFSNISVDATSTVTGGGIIGGLVAMVCDIRKTDMTDTNVTKFEYISFAGTVTCNGGAGRHGGIVGSWQTDCDLDFDYCGFSGTLNGSAVGQMAAIVGTGMNADPVAGAPKQNITMDYCYNTGKLDASGASSVGTGAIVTGTIGTVGRHGAGSVVTIQNFYDASQRVVAANFGGSLSAAASFGFQNYNNVQVTLKDCFAAHQKVTMADPSNYDNGVVYGDNKAYSSDFTEPVALNVYNNHSGLYANENSGVPTAVVTNNNSWMVASATAEITLTGAAAPTTINAEIAKINAAIAAMNVEPEQPGGEQPGGEQPGGEQPGGEQAGGEQTGGDQTNTTDETTTAPADTTTEAPAEEKKGCGSSVSAMYAVLALTAIVGCAFVAKRKEEN